MLHDAQRTSAPSDLQGLDQDRGLDGHVQRAGDAGAAQWLLGAVLLARRHQARHLGLRDGELAPAPFGEADVLDDVIGGGGFGFWAAVMIVLLVRRSARVGSL